MNIDKIVESYMSSSKKVDVNGGIGGNHVMFQYDNHVMRVFKDKTVYTIGGKPVEKEKFLESSKGKEINRGYMKMKSDVDKYHKFKKMNIQTRV